MKFIKLVILMFDLFGALKPIIIITEEYGHEQTLEVFAKVYDLISKIFKISYSKAEFLTNVNKYLTIILYIVDKFYDTFPDLFHTLTWKYVEFEKNLWLQVVDKLMVNAQESKEEIQDKIKYYHQEYKADVAEELIKRDLKSQLKKFELNWETSVKKAIKDIKDQLSDEKPPYDPDMWDGGWYDKDGWHPKPRKE